MNSQLLITLIVFGFILFDVIVGIVNAYLKHELSSSKMREGLQRKMGEIFLMLLADGCYFSMLIPPFDSIGVPADIVNLISLFIVLMELVSIIENICKLNPELPIAKIFAIFNIDIDTNEDSN